MLELSLCFLGKKGMLRSDAALEKDDVLDVMGVGEHVDRLNGGDAVVGVHEGEVSCLGGRVATDIDDAVRGSAEDGCHNVGMHSSARRVGDDDIRTALSGNEVVREDIFHVAGVEFGVCDSVEGGVDAGIVNGFWNVFDADNAGCIAGDEVCDGAGAGIEVVDGLVAGKVGQFADAGV